LLCEKPIALTLNGGKAMLGAKRLPDKWIKPLRDTFFGQIIGYHPIAVSECARHSVEIAKTVLKSS
jgi:hypothetical protein